MSAPTRDPLVVNTQDGACWVRRAVTREGRGLYAVADAPKCCPEFVMATLAELAEHGLASMADALPMPVSPESPVDADRAKAPWGRGEDGRPLLPMGAHWTDIPELVDQEVASIRARVDQAQPGSWYVSPIAEAPGTVCTQYDGYTRTVGRFTNVLPADLELALHAHGDLRWCLDMIDKLRARVAELEAEVLLLNTLRGDVALLVERERGFGEECVDIDDVEAALALESDEVVEADGITRRIAPTQTLREDEPATKCRCDEPGADPYACEADDCTGEFSELNPFGGGPVHGHDAKVSRQCACGWLTTVWHVDDGSAEEELHGHVARVHGGVS